MTRNVTDADACFLYDRYVRHDRKKRVIAAMTCFHLIAAIAAKKGLNPGVKLDVGAKFNPQWRQSTNDSC